MNGKSNSQFLLWARKANNLMSLNIIALRGSRSTIVLLELLLEFISQNKIYSPFMPAIDLIGNKTSICGLCKALKLMTIKGIISWQEEHKMRLYIQYFAKEDPMSELKSYVWVRFLKWPRQAWLKKHIKWQKELLRLQE